MFHNVCNLRYNYSIMWVIFAGNLKNLFVEAFDLLSWNLNLNYVSHCLLWGYPTRIFLSALLVSFKKSFKNCLKKVLKLRNTNWEKTQIMNILPTLWKLTDIMFPSIVGHF